MFAHPAHPFYLLLITACTINLKTTREKVNEKKENKMSLTLLETRKSEMASFSRLS